jgi:cellulose synthase/poly-beta-1,6-N-acetylglucosamine synthase-like glycosyltransferase
MGWVLYDIMAGFAFIPLASAQEHCCIRLEMELSTLWYVDGLFSGLILIPLPTHHFVSYNIHYLTISSTLAVKAFCYLHNLSIHTAIADQSSHNSDVAQPWNITNQSYLLKS